MNFTFTWLLNKFGFQPEVNFTEPVAKKKSTAKKAVAKKVVAKKTVRKKV